jgi:hypothetical protein
MTITAMQRIDSGDIINFIVSMILLTIVVVLVGYISEGKINGD